MPAPRYLPNADEIIRMMEKEGLTQGEIADRYGVGPAAVSAALAREGKTKDRRVYPELIPWRVRQIHNNSYDLRMLRWEGQMRNGMNLPSYRLQKLANWKNNLRQADAVIHYDPDTEQGFFRVEKRPRIDIDLVRIPDDALPKSKKRSS